MKPTLEQIRARCKAQDGHLLWQGKMTRGRNPRWTFDGADHNVRRIAYEGYSGVTLQPQQLVGTCSDWRCLAEGCLHLTTKAEAARRGYANPEAKQRHAEAVRRSARMARILSDDQARLARTAQQSRSHVAAFLGCSPDLVDKIRTGERYGDVR